MFVDQAKIKIKAGNGGNGKVSFHREKFVAAGGPDGGDGGKGGSVIFAADPNHSTLLDFKYKRKYEAKNGEDGKGGNCTGKDAEDLIIRVPVGTVVYDCHTGLVLFDLSTPGEQAVAAKGGDGGFGNKRFATPTRQIPRFSKPGYPGQEREIRLELKLIADVGLLGFPNVGKSTFLSVSTKANPKIANYHFTTLTPNLGVVMLKDGRSFVIADIPGVVEGASEGVGLGHDFLRHVERTRLLLHVLDASGMEGRDPKEDFEIINRELAQYSDRLASRKQIILLNKIDLIYEKKELEELKKYFEQKGYPVFLTSGVTQKGIQEVLSYAWKRLLEIPIPEIYEEDQIFREELLPQEEPFKAFVDEEGVFCVEGPLISRLLQTTDPQDYEAMQYFQRVLRSHGVIDALEELGVKEGDLVRLEDLEFEFIR